MEIVQFIALLLWVLLVNGKLHAMARTIAPALPSVSKEKSQEPFVYNVIFIYLFNLFPILVDWRQP